MDSTLRVQAWSILGILGGLVLCARLTLAAAPAPPAPILGEVDGVVRVLSAGVTPGPATDPLLLGQPIDLNHASAATLETLPGVGPSLARAIVEDREERGVFHEIDALDRVRGVGPRLVTSLRPLLFVEPGLPAPSAPAAPEVVAPARVNVNSADLQELDTLPGIGPGKARAIMEYRKSHGPFRSLRDLDRVKGIGPSTLRNLRNRVEIQ